ncbi:MAG: AMP-binding protein [Candidatus Saccharibacteria bacterium]
MKYNDFSEFVGSFSGYGHRTATTIKPFIKTNKQTYGQLQKNVYKTANYLIGRGVHRGERIMVVATNSPEWIELFLGCQLIGAILVPVDSRNSIETVNNFIIQTAPLMIFRGNYVLPKLDRTKRTVILEDLDELINDYHDVAPNIKLDGQDTALIVFTSGTTAAPKGVVLSQKNILSNIEGVKKMINIDPNWRVLSVLPLSHMYELTGECCMLSAGASTYYLPTIAPLAIAKALADYKITTILAVPQLLTLFKQRITQTAIAEGQEKTLQFGLKIAPYLPKKIKRMLFAKVHKKLGGKLAIVITGGAPIPIDVAYFWENMGVRALQGYGLTETSPILTANRVKDKFRDTQGLVLHNIELKVAKDGEILAKGPSIFEKYWQNPEQTKQTFTEDGWFKTGDMGRIDKGWLIIQGRAKFVIVLPSGLNVFPEDVEAVADKSKDIKEICVIGVKTEEGEEVFAAVISDKKDRAIDKAIKDINNQLEDFQHISKWQRYEQEEFPRTLLLKVDRKNIQKWANDREKPKIKAKSGQKHSDEPLIKIIRLSLNEPQVAIKDSDGLADIGLDSLKRLAVLSMIEEQLGIYIPESKIDKHTTLKTLRKLVAKGSHTQVNSKRPKWQFNKVIRLVGVAFRATVVRGLLRLCVKIEKVEGAENLNGLDGPAIYIFNHVDSFDVPVVYKALPKKIRDNLAAAAADDVMKRHKILTFASRLGFVAYNLDRLKMILPSLEYTAELLEKGWSIAIAPEGHVSKDGHLQSFKSGIGLLAVETGVPIIPIKTFGLAGTLPLDKKWPQKFSHVTVRIGQPLIIDRHTSYEKATKRLYKAMKKL